MKVEAKAVANYVKAKVHNAIEESRRPSNVTAAQHAHLKAFPACEACPEGAPDATLESQAHHEVPFNEDPKRGADPSNFITLCEHVGGPEHHLHVGHGGDFKHYNPTVRADAAALRAAKTAGQKNAILARILACRKPNVPPAPKRTRSR